MNGGDDQRCNLTWHWSKTRTTRATHGFEFRAVTGHSIANIIVNIVDYLFFSTTCFICWCIDFDSLHKYRLAGHSIFRFVQHWSPNAFHQMKLIALNHFKNGAFLMCILKCLLTKCKQFFFLSRNGRFSCCCFRFYGHIYEHENNIPTLKYFIIWLKLWICSKEFIWLIFNSKWNCTVLWNQSVWSQNNQYS